MEIKLFHASKFGQTHLLNGIAKSEFTKNLVLVFGFTVYFSVF